MCFWVLLTLPYHASGPWRSRSRDLLFFSFRVMTRRATLVGAKRHAAAGGGYRRGAEVRKQGELWSAPSEQGDYVFEGQARQGLVRQTRRSLVQVQPPQPWRSRSRDLLFFCVRRKACYSQRFFAKHYRQSGCIILYYTLLYVLYWNLLKEFNVYKRRFGTVWIGNIFFKKSILWFKSKKMLK